MKRNSHKKNDFDGETSSQQLFLFSHVQWHIGDLSLRSRPVRAISPPLLLLLLLVPMLNVAAWLKTGERLEFCQEVDWDVLLQVAYRLGNHSGGGRKR